MQISDCNPEKKHRDEPDSGPCTTPHGHEWHIVNEKTSVVRFLCTDTYAGSYIEFPIVVVGRWTYEARLVPDGKVEVESTAMIATPFSTLASPMAVAFSLDW